MPTTKMTPKLRKNRYFVLDTNVLLHDANSLFAFKCVVVAIPFIVLEELDKFKTETGEKGRNAREVIRTLDRLREKGSLSEGVELPCNGDSAMLKVIPTPLVYNEPFLNLQTADNIILQTVHDFIEQGLQVTFVTKDINARVKADALGIEAEDYVKGTISVDKFYKGWQVMQLPARELKLISRTNLPELTKKMELVPNEFVTIESLKNPEHYRIFRYLGGKNFKEVKRPVMRWNFEARNPEQLMALDLLLDDDIKMLSLLGPAGTGKTFLTLLAGLEKVARTKVYQKFLVTRPVVPLGADIGYLPGDVQEKLHNWMMPIRDNLEYIFAEEAKFLREHKGIEEKEHKGDKQKKGKRGHRERRRHSPSDEIDMLTERGIMSMEAITYMRGRSIPYQYIFIDEVQNLTPHEVKTIVSRVGEGSKIILAGDPYQIDSPYLNFSSNGLTVTSEKFKGQSIYGTVFLEKSERSRLAELAIELL